MALRSLSTKYLYLMQVKHVNDCNSQLPNQFQFFDLRKEKRKLAVRPQSSISVTKILKNKILVIVGTLRNRIPSSRGESSGGIVCISFLML